jgi:hypothetical protein
MSKVRVGNIEHDKLSHSELPAGCLGYKQDLTEEEWTGKEICGASNLVFEDRDSYLAHVSPVTGFKPTEIEHQDVLTEGRASRIAKKAQKRAKDRAEKKGGKKKGKK